MKKNNFLDFLIILLLNIGLSCFPFSRFHLSGLAIILSQIGVQIFLIVFKILYVKFKSKLSLKTEKFNLSNSLFLIPTLLVCFSNYFYLIFTSREPQFIFLQENILPIILTLLIVINEELIFRLIFINNLENKNVWFKIFISSLIFGIAHLANFLSTMDTTYLIQIAYTIPLGILLAISFVVSNSIYPCIVIHFLFNLFNEIIWKNLGPTIPNTNMGMENYILANASVGLVVAIYLLILILTKYKKIFFLKEKRN